MLVRLLASLHDDEGNVAVEGLHEASAAPVERGADRVRDESGLLDGVSEIGSGTVAQRMWAKPAITVIGIDTTPIDKASNTLIPRARAKISMRVAPGGDAAAHLQALRRHLEQHAPWGAHVTVTPGEVGQPYAIDATGPVYDAARAAFRQAWGVDAVDMGMGGSIPFIAELAAAFPGATILVTGVEDPANPGAQRQRESGSGCAGTGRRRRGVAAGLTGCAGRSLPVILAALGVSADLSPPI